MNGFRFRANPASERPKEKASLNHHLKYITKKLHTTLTRSMWTDVYQSAISAHSSTESSKLTLLCQRLQTPGPPLHMALDSVPLPHHKAAVASFLCADWFFGKYAHNYFARNLLPKSQNHISIVQDTGIAADTLCLPCWHHRRDIFLDDEFHLVCVCPEYHRQRTDG